MRFPTIEEIRAKITLEPSTVVEQIFQVVSNLNTFGKKMNAVSYIAEDYAIERAKEIYSVIIDKKRNFVDDKSTKNIRTKITKNN